MDIFLSGLESDVNADIVGVSRRRLLKAPYLL